MRVRVWTALISAAIFLWSLHAGVLWPFWLVLLTAYGAGLEELARLLGWGLKTRIAGWAYTLAGVTGCVFTGDKLWPAVVGCLGLFLVGCVGVVARKVDKPHPMAWLGVGWLLMPVLWMGLVHSWWKGGGLNPVALYGMALFLGDTLALFVGKAIGKTPLAPSLSAGKTWEGAAAAFGGCLIGSLGFGLSFGYSLVACLALGVCLGVLGTLGDLFESFMKRRSGVKDSGGFFPGHGGVLDRVDSMMMTAIPGCLILILLEPEKFHVKQLLDGILR